MCYTTLVKFFFMKKAFHLIALIVLFGSCTEKESSHNYSQVKIETVFEDSVSIRAIEFLDANTLAFAGSGGLFGTVDIKTGKIRTNVQKYDSILPAFRAVAHTSEDFFMLTVGSPALLYKTGEGGKMELVYKEEGENLFYDAMKFWNDKEGIAIGDSVDGCLSVLITRDGGRTWRKTPCEELPEGIEGEGAFAASNSNIGITGDKTWIATTESRIYFSPDKGQTWEIQTVPIVGKLPTQGIYSIHFYDDNLGVAIGGDYTKPEDPRKNKALTTDGGESWGIIADGNPPGYKSCVRFIPNSGGEDIVAIGFTGIAYSKTKGKTWTDLNNESFYTVRFLNDSIAYAAGKNRIAKLTFQ